MEIIPSTVFVEKTVSSGLHNRMKMQTIRRNADVGFSAAVKVLLNVFIKLVKYQAKV